MLADWLALQDHPIDDLHFRDQCRHTLDAAGVLVLRDFFTEALRAHVLREVDDQQDGAFYANQTHNIWLTEPDRQLADDHIYNRQFVSSKGLLADDQLAADSPLRTVYDALAFRSFIAAVVGAEELFPYADELSSINVHFHQPGQELGWHFDNSSFAVTALIRVPQAGGHFEYVPSLRTSATDDQNFAGVSHAVSTGEGVQTLTFGEGDLVLFRGRDSMHRVTPSEGDVTRVLVVFAWNDRPGIGLSDSAKQTFYGRLA